ncbi:hypothetical protein WJX75_004117 [Coccomyxa subellipsoidea]|uniref:Stc1 domain-containing protein n=1 Tax=Coccomyxa subellipsoidea TaxID=248742 RepID=A0ABR2YF84_9CHLO
MADIVDVVDLTARQQPVQPQTTSGADVIYLDLTQEQIALVQHEYGSGCAGPEKGEGIGYDREYQAKKSRPLDPSTFERKIVKADHTRPCDTCGELSHFSMGAIFREEPYMSGSQAKLCNACFNVQFPEYDVSKFKQKSVRKPELHQRKLCEPCFITEFSDASNVPYDTQYSYNFNHVGAHFSEQAGEHEDEDQYGEDYECASEDFEAAHEEYGEGEEDFEEEDKGAEEEDEGSHESEEDKETEEQLDAQEVNLCTDLALVPGQSVRLRSVSHRACMLPATASAAAAALSAVQLQVQQTNTPKAAPSPAAMPPPVAQPVPAAEPQPSGQHRQTSGHSARVLKRKAAESGFRCG